MKENILETTCLTKKYGAQSAVNHISMQVEKGAIYGLIGKNGAGKTGSVIGEDKVLSDSLSLENRYHLFKRSHIRDMTSFVLSDSLSMTFFWIFIHT